MADLWEQSPVRLPDDFRLDAVLLLSALFQPGEMVNIVSAFSLNGEKANPLGYGETAEKGKWLEKMTRNGTPVSNAGVWIRPNPLDGNGVTDENVTAFRFLLVEFDNVPIPLQTAFLARLSLPIAAVLTSGGKSLHAWVRINAPTETAYRAVAKRIFDPLAQYGVDMANRNPSRLSRLPGVYRKIGSGSDNRQRLIYLNAQPNGKRIIP